MRAPAPEGAQATQALCSKVLASLDVHGYAILEGFVPPASLCAMRAELHEALRATPHGRNSFEGGRTQR